MKDIVITPRQVRRECWILAACVLVSILIDLGAILFYHRPFTELFRTLGYVLVIALSLYLIQAALRLLLFALSRLFRRG